MGKNTNSNSGSNILQGVSGVIIGILVIIMTWDAVINSFKEAPYLYELKAEGLNGVDYVQEDIYAALDYFMYEETTRTKYGIKLSSKTSAYYYIIPVLSENNEELYMAVEVPASAEPEMYGICCDTLALLTGSIKPTQFGEKSYHVRGQLRNMKQEEIQYMIEWFQETEFFDTTDPSVILDHIYPVMIEKDDTISSRLMMGGGFFFIISGVFVVISNARSPRPKRTKNENRFYGPSEENYSSKSTFQPYQPFQQEGATSTATPYSSPNIKEYDSMYVPPSERQTNTTLSDESTQPTRREFPASNNGVYQPFNTQQENQYQSKIMQMHAAMYQKENSGQNRPTGTQTQSSAFPARNSQPQTGAFPARDSQPQASVYQTEAKPVPSSESDTYREGRNTETESYSYPSPNISFYDSPYADE